MKRQNSVRQIVCIVAAAAIISVSPPVQTGWAGQPAAEEPPEPPVARNDEYYPISYRSFATDISDDRDDHAANGYRQGTMTWSEWWYSYDRVDYTYLVGIGLLTLTPMSPSVTNWSALEDFTIDLSHETKGCTYQASKPDENSPGIQLSAGVTITADGPEVGGGASWGVLAAGVTVTDVGKDGQRVSWESDISDGSATASGGVNDLLFFAEWRCPKGTDFARTHVLGVGSFELDNWGSGDTTFVFGGNGSLDTSPSTGSSAPLDGSSRGYWRFNPEKDRWEKMPDYYERTRQASRTPTSPSEGSPRQVSRAPDPAVEQMQSIFNLFAGQIDRRQRDRRDGSDEGMESRAIIQSGMPNSAAETVMEEQTGGATAGPNPAVETGEPRPLSPGTGGGRKRRAAEAEENPQSANRPPPPAEAETPPPQEEVEPEPQTIE